jgi:hypothetical protein
LPASFNKSISSKKIALDCLTSKKSGSFGYDLKKSAVDAEHELTLEEKREIILLLGILVTLRPKVKLGPRWEGESYSSTLRLSEVDIVGFEFPDSTMQIDL